jgi:acetyl esterase/lipase
MKIALFILLVASSAAGQEVALNIPYAAPGDERQALDVYAAKGAKHLPVVVWIHGGGWVSGDKSEVGVKPRAFGEQGFVFVSINYRLLTEPVSKPAWEGGQAHIPPRTPENEPDPGRLKPHVEMGEIVRDVAKAVGWVHKNIARHGGNGARMVVMGHSAGAQLAALVCTDERYLQADGVPFSALKGCVPVDGDTYDIPAIITTAEIRQTVHGLPLPTFGHRQKFGNDPAKHIEFSAVTHAAKGKGIPPFLILHVAGHPDVTAQAKRLEAALSAAEVPVTVFGAEETTHRRLNENLGRDDDPSTKELFKFLEGI